MSLELSIEQIRNIVKPIAQEFELTAVWIFGSCARGDFDAESDIDLLVDRSGVHRSLFDPLGLISLKQKLELSLKSPVDIITTSALTQNIVADNFNETVFKERVLIYQTCRKTPGFNYGEHQEI